MASTNEVLLTIPDCSLSHLLAGNILVLGHGTLEVKLVATPPPYDSGTQSAHPSSSTSSKDPSRGISPSVSPPGLLLSLGRVGLTEPIYELVITTSSVLLAQPPHAYLVGIPKSSSMGVDTSQEAEEDKQGFVRIVLPSTISSEARETFEAILWSHAARDSDMRGKLVLVDQESGEVLGELASDVEIPAVPDAEDDKSTTADDGVAVVDFEDGKISVSVKSRTWSEWKPTLNPSGSKIITMGDYVSRGIVAGADAIGMGLEKGGRKVVSSSRATQSPMVFSNSTRRNVNATNDLTSGARIISGKTLSVIGGLASKAGGAIGQSLGIQPTSNGEIPTGLKGVVHKSLIAINTVVESLETGGKVLLDAGSNSATSVVEHRYGSEAAEISRSLGSSVKHVVLVYVDAQGVTRNALLKSAGKGAVKAKMADGREVILTEGSGSVIEKSPVIAVVGTEQESVHVPNSVAPSGKD